MSYLDIDLSEVTISSSTLSLLPDGRHNVMIKSVRVTKTSTNADQLEVKYQNDAGAMTQWIIFNHPNSDAATKIGREQLKLLLTNLSYDGAKPPSVDWYEGKGIGIEIRSRYHNGKSQPNVTKTFKSDAAVAAKPELDDEIPF